MAKKHKRRNKRMANERKRIKGDLDSNEQGISTRSDDVSPSDQLREPRLEPKHKIFLSHSGAQKDFTEQLCEDLERLHHFPFFDKCPDSLPKGEKFAPLIKEAAKQCRVAVLVLSDEFFTHSKWPMIELTEFVKAQESTNTRLKILPLFLGITMEQFKEKKRQEHWLEKWRDMARKDSRIDVEEWEHALSRIPGGINVMEYKGVTEGHVAFRKKVVAAVCKLVPPDVKWNVSHVRSVEQLCKPILEKLKETEPSHKYGVRVVGLYGMGGVGKTTVSKVVCNQMFEDFDGKACHVELGGLNLIELQKTVLQELTEASSKILSNSADQLTTLLKKRMCRQKVFLILDNVWDNQIEDVLMYLEAGYQDGSIVLVTSRSLDILVQRLHIRICDCLEMPQLDEEGAIELFLHHAARSHELSFGENDKKIIKICVEECCYLKGERPGSNHQLNTYQYLPLALKALGSQLGSISHDVSRWKESLKKLKSNKFNMLKDKIHPVFSILRLGYDALCSEEQHIFLDLALFLIPQWRFYPEMSDVWTCLSIIHRKTEDDIKESVKALRRKGLLDKVSEVDELEYKIHDLYLDFAEAEARAGPFKRRCFLLDKEGTAIPHELLKNPSGSCWPCLEKLIICRSKVQSLKKAKFHFCSNAEVLQLVHCEQLEEVDVTGMESLRFMEVLNCNKLGERIEGVETLSNLVCLRWFNYFTSRASDLKFLHDLSLLTALEVLQLTNLNWPKEDIFPPNLSGCLSLRELTLSNLRTVSGPSTASGLPDFCNLPKSLLKINFSNCTAKLIGSSPISAMSSFTSLQHLNVMDCEKINDLTGLSELISLQELNVSWTKISALPDLRKLEQLEFLIVSNCNKLKSLIGIVNATSLRRVVACGCEILRELPDDFSSLKKLEMLDLSEADSLRTLPNDYERLAECNILKVNHCWGLVVPLVKELQRLVLERSHVNCVNSTGCVSRCEQSIQLWINARKDLSRAAYDLLKGVFSDHNIESHWSYLLDDGERGDVLVRALCEHDDRGRKRLRSVVAQVTELGFDSTKWWAVVVAAPCTFGVVTERAMLEPWDKTLLHYTIVRILPDFLVGRNQALIWSEGNWPRKWVKRGIEVVLQKCKEQLQEASDHNIDLVRSMEGMEVAETFLKEIEATNGQQITRSSLLRYISTDGSSYSDFFPNFPFGPTLATQDLSWYQSFSKKKYFDVSTDDFVMGI